MGRTLREWEGLGTLKTIPHISSADSVCLWCPSDFMLYCLLIITVYTVAIQSHVALKYNKTKTCMQFCFAQFWAPLGLPIT